MERPFDYKQVVILYVDDEEKSVRNFARAFGDQFRILTATTARQGLALFEQHRDEVGVLMTDQRMPGERGVWLLEQARTIAPQTLRILVTAYAEMEVAIEAVNSGAIYKYVTKPWDPPMLEALLKRAIEFYVVQRERDDLLREKVAILRNLSIADRLLSLGLLAAGLNHHIRNALVAVRTFLDLTPLKLRDEGVDPSRARDPEFWNQYHQDVLGQLERINQLLHDLWSAAERPSLEFKDVVDLEEILSSAAAALGPRLAARDLRLSWNLAPTLPRPKVDRRQFTRLFELLLEDELVSLPPGCRVSITAAVEPASAGTNRAELRIEVSDNGPGLPPETLRMIFDPFMVRNDSPSEFGIRLMACFFIVHQHGGRITARSAPDKGTIFILHVPVEPSDTMIAEDSQRYLEQMILRNDSLLKNHLTSP
jgi:two-component system, probable response regulator PhcQ